MKAWLIGACVAGTAVAVAPSRAHAQQVDKGSFGIGIILGEPTGISARLYLNDNQAVQAAIGSAFVGGGLQVHADYVFHPWILEENESFTLPAYVGPGARIIQYDEGRDSTDSLALGVRAVAGVVFDFKTIPIDAFAEAAAVFEYTLTGDTGFGLAVNASLGARFYF